MADVYVGTCSWADHKRFYPDSIESRDKITYYAQHFPVVEINSTFYRMMPERNYRLWAERTPPGFVFDVKPYRQMTWHDRKTPPDDEQTRAFRETLQPLRDAGKLGVVHFQFPPWFVDRPRNRDYICHLRDLFPDDRLGVEFRHRSWLEDQRVPETVQTLRDLGIGLTIVDEPQLGSGSVPTVLEITQPQFAVVRFHGRNYQRWYARGKTSAERFDYLYSEDELEDWIPQVRQLADGAAVVHLLFNNNAEDYAIRNARQLGLMLGGALTAHHVVPPAAE